MPRLQGGSKSPTGSGDARRWSPTADRGPDAASVRLDGPAVTTICLVHGAFHGGWCWIRVVHELRDRGYNTVAPDLPCDDPDAGLAVYARAVEAEIDAAHATHPDDDLVLVGHSLGSLTVPLVASRRPVRRMVFLCSVPTGPGPAIAEDLAGMVTPEFLAAPRFWNKDGLEMLSNQAARELFFHDCPESVACWAVAMLRPQAPRPKSEPSPLTAWPDVPMSVILATDDRAANTTWAIAEARRRLGGEEPVLIEGGHSPFLSRPTQLADLLVREVTG